MRRIQAPSLHSLMCIHTPLNIWLGEIGDRVNIPLDRDQPTQTFRNSTTKDLLSTNLPLLFFETYQPFEVSKGLQ